MTPKLQAALKALLPQQDTADATQALQHRYRHASARGFPNQAERYAYLASRMPATYGVLDTVFQQLPQGFTPSSIIDFGCGPGTGLLSAATRWPDSSYTLVDTDAAMLAFGQELHRRVIPNTQATWVHQSFMTWRGEKSSLGICAYALNELPDHQQLKALETLWAAVSGVLVLVFPGTPKDFATLLRARTWLLAQGAWIVAPCPHQEACPLLHTPDWCHFSTTLDRPDFQRRAKQARLSWQLEKYSYLIVSRTPEPRATGRLIRKPLHRTGHVVLDVCYQGRIERAIVAKNHDRYRQARKAEWGDPWDYLYEAGTV